MRFPKVSDLDREQTRIYQGAPVDGTILIVGPPGTGKTVIAFHRAEVLKRKGQSPRVVMFNKVLSRYTDDRGDVAGGVKVSTFHYWVYHWWKAMKLGHIPMVVGSKYDHDWDEIQRKAIGYVRCKETAKKLSWGHLIVDEGQDFPSKMYSVLKTMMAIANGKGVNPPVAISVLADENQRLSEGRNSTIEQVRIALGLHVSDRNVFSLKKNYRNTKQIAAFASNFYAGLPSGKPDLPLRSGVLPVVSIVKRESDGANFNAFVEKISRYASINLNKEIGVLVPNNKIRKSIFNRLKKRFDATKINLQTYERDSEEHDAKCLKFDKPGFVTVLNYQSTKGLEFDAVFVVDPGAMLFGGSSEISMKMAVYVMSSRARDYLNLMLIGGDGEKRILDCLPPASGVYDMEEL